MSKNHWVIGGLVALNVLLGVMLYQRFGEPKAMAQARRGSDFVTVTGHTPNGTVFYALDTSTGVLGAYLVPFNQNPKQATLIDAINIVQEQNRMGGRR